MSESDEDRQGDIKVTDKRMFTADGELREEYRYLEEQRGDTAGAEEAAAEEKEKASPAPSVTTESKVSQAAPAPSGPDLGIPGTRPTSPESKPPEPASPGESPEVSSSAGPGTPLELPDTADSVGKPSFLDLLATLAEPATIYLGDVQLPDGKSAEDLRLARFYIDLLAVMREKTQGNLSAQERTVLEDLVYRLQMRYVQKRG